MKIIVWNVVPSETDHSHSWIKWSSSHFIIYWILFFTPKYLCSVLDVLTMWNAFFFYPEEIQDFFSPSSLSVEIKRAFMCLEGWLALLCKQLRKCDVKKWKFFFGFGSSLFYGQTLLEKPVKSNIGEHCRFFLPQFSSTQVGSNKYFYFDS